MRVVKLIGAYLQKIELSHENDSLLVDYIDLANEVMESFVLYLQESAEARKIKDAITAFNSPQAALSQSQNLPLKQLNTNHQVYKDKLARQMYPMQIFPYIHSLESTRSMLSALGTSRLSVMRCFRSEPRAVSKLLTPDDYNSYTSRPNIPTLAITGESFWPSHSASLFLGMSLASYVETANQEFNIASFWGYKFSDYAAIKSKSTITATKNLTGVQLASEAMIDDSSGIGLAFIKEQFLPRSGLSFDDLIALLRTQYVAHRLTIVPMAQVGKDFEGHLSDMKLRVSVVNTADQPPGKFTSAVCEELGWDVAKLDKCISCLKRNAAATGLPGVYCRGIAPEAGVPNFAGRPFTDYERQLLDVFELSKEDLAPLMDAAGLSMKSKMTLQSLSLLYRLLFICRTLEISYADCAVFLRVVDSSYGLFTDPRSTLQAIKSFKELNAQGWDLESLALVLKKDNDIHTVVPNEGPAVVVKSISKSVWRF
ncbi:hypothetical protein QBC43DRAFT_289203 [Cladorrhinum sp. PSN259]|nr:hypothetical protein QBC43DRAFT_289203 [Cladorrhinum sp. PSN259]